MHFKRVIRKGFAFLALLAMVIGLLPTVLYAEGEHDLTLNGGAVTWDFTNENALIYTAPYKDGSLSGSEAFDHHGNDHGAVFFTNDVSTELLTLAVPEGETEVTLSLCEYSDADGEFVISYDSVGEVSNSVIKAQVAADGEAVSFTYTGEAGNVVISYQGGTSYLHSLTAESITPVERATVSGTVSGPSLPSAEGEILLFTAEDSSVEQTVVTNGSYTIDLPVGTTYSVAFENSAVFGVTEGTSIDLHGQGAGDAVTNNIVYDVLWDSTKTFDFTVGGTEFTVTPGNLPTDDFRVTTDDLTQVELVTTTSAIIWADLGGDGTLQEEDVTDVSGTVSYAVHENTITFTYKEGNTSPDTFAVIVKDNSAAGAAAADGVEKVYDFREGEIVSSLYVGDYAVQNGQSVKSVDGLLEVVGNNKVYYNSSQHGIVINNGDVVRVKVAGSAEIVLSLCSYTDEGGKFTVSSDKGEPSIDEVAAHVTDDGSGATVIYDGPVDETGTVTFTYSGSQGYLHSISATSSMPVAEAVVSGTVTGSAAVEGEKLLFTGADGTSREAFVENGMYSLRLPVGTTYQVSFENSEVFGVTGEATIDLINVSDGTAVTHDITCAVLWDAAKSFSFTVSGRTFTVVPGNSPADDFTVSSDDGGVELVTSDTALLWAELGAGGYGTLTNSDMESVSDTVTYALNGNTITFTYVDQNTSPKSFEVVVKDDSASGTPHADGVEKVYDFRDGSVVSELYSGNYVLKDGKTVTSTDKLLTLTGNNRISYNGAQHGMIISDGDQISIKVAGNATITLSLCGYAAADGKFTVTSSGEVSVDEFAAQMTDGEETTFTYTGGAGEVVLTYSGGSGYVHWLSVLNEAEETIVTDQEEMPSVQYGSNLNVSYNGQTLILANTGGELTSGEAVSDTVGYYGFDETRDANRLEADVTVTNGGSSSANGVFVGVFTNDELTSLGIRHGNNLRGMYTGEDGLLNAGGVNAAVAEGETIHFVIEKTDEGYVLTATTTDGTSYSFERETETDSVSYGLVLAGADVLVTNMKYYGEDGNLLYDQNDAYSPIGIKPVITDVEAASNADRTGILVTWDCSEIATGDGRYVIQVKYEDGQWQDAIVTSDLSCTYPAELAGTYSFRVGGRLGNDGEVTWCENIAVVEDYLPALDRPVLSAEAHKIGETDEPYVALTWNAIDGAETYQVYRYAYGEQAACIGEVSTTSYQDSDVEFEVPYYYYVIAMSATNSGNPSNTVWSLITGERTGEYAQEGSAAVLTFTTQPSDTVRVKAVDFELSADRKGTLDVVVNGSVTKTVSSEAGISSGIIRTDLKEGRNTIEFIFTDENGVKTKETFNIVCLSNIDMVVDSASQVEDGTLVDGIPTYTSMQAAVDAAPANSDERTVIYVKAGDYEERLVVDKPNISLLGEDRDTTLVHCYPADLYSGDPGYEAGGDMTKRCAVYITANAVNFSAENISFANDYVYGTPDGKSNKSADALRSDADNAVFVNVKFSGVQDTLYLHQGNQYFYQCQIEGLIDFIYTGDEAKVLFDDCDIVFVHEETHPDSGYICAPRTSAAAQYGLVFNNCRITAEEGVESNEDTHFRLARPWGPDAAIYWINCYMGSVVDRDEPYADMSGNAFMNARFYEYGSYGPGYMINEFRRQISPAEAASILNQMVPGETAAMADSRNAYIGLLTPADPKPLPEEPEVTPTPDETAKPEVTPTPTPAPGETPSPSQPSDNNQQNGTSIETGNYASPWIWIGVIVVAVVGIGAVLFMKKKKQ